MNQLQFDQWQEFSTKAIEPLTITDARKEKLRVNVPQFFEEIRNYHDISEIDCWEDILGLFQDFFVEFYVKHEREKCSSFQSQLMVVIRAGIDVISGDFGVANWFTAGDVKLMFGGQIPSYVTARFISTAFDDDENILPF